MVVRHAVKNVLIPVVTMVGLQLPILVGGAVIIENIFNLPGLGRLMLACVEQQPDDRTRRGLRLLVQVGAGVADRAASAVLGNGDECRP